MLGDTTNITSISLAVTYGFLMHCTAHTLVNSHVMIEWSMFLMNVSGWYLQAEYCNHNHMPHSFQFGVEYSLNGKQQKIGDILDIPFGQCRKRIGWLQSRRRDCLHEWTGRLAAFHLVQNELTNGAVELQRLCQQIRIDERNVAANLRTVNGGKKNKTLR